MGEFYLKRDLMLRVTTNSVALVWRLEVDD